MARAHHSSHTQPSVCSSRFSGQPSSPDRDTKHEKPEKTPDPLQQQQNQPKHDQTHPNQFLFQHALLFNHDAQAHKRVFVHYLEGILLLDCFIELKSIF